MMKSMETAKMKIAIASGKGGTGKTTFATLFSKAISPSYYIDADVEEPNGHIFLKPQIQKEEDFTELVPKIIDDKCTFCGVCADECPYKALVIIKPTKKWLFFPELCHSCGICSYVCPVKGALIEVPKKKGVIREGRAGDIGFMDGILNLGEPTPVPLIVKLLRKIPESDLPVVIDAPPGTSCPVVETLGVADFVLLVSVPTPFGVYDLSLAVKLTKDLGKPFAIVENKYTPENNLLKEYAEKEGIEIIFRLPYDEEIAKSYSKGELPFERFREPLKNLFVKIKGRLK